MGSNISRDHIAMEAMKVLMQKTVSKDLTLKNRIRKFFGKDYNVQVVYNSETLAEASYAMADAMIAQREKILEDKL
nr:MAG TPA_asm: hypothetical protein [Caudoviricetes sp.]